MLSRSNLIAAHAFHGAWFLSGSTPSRRLIGSLTRLAERFQVRALIPNRSANAQVRKPPSLAKGNKRPTRKVQQFAGLLFSAQE